MSYFKVVARHFPAQTEKEHQFVLQPGYSTYGPSCKPGNSRVQCRNDSHMIAKLDFLYFVREGEEKATEPTFIFWLSLMVPRY